MYNLQKRSLKKSVHHECSLSSDSEDSEAEGNQESNDLDIAQNECE